MESLQVNPACEVETRTDLPPSMSDDIPSSNDALDKTAVPYYVARAELVTFFLGFVQQSSTLALSVKRTMHSSTGTLLFVALSVIGELQANP